MNYTGPKVRLSRRLGIAFTPKAAKVMTKKPYGPGQHGAGASRRRGGKTSLYQRQLVEKQRLKVFYNIHEKMLRNYYAKATAWRGSTSEILIQKLETRLDAVVQRSGLARTIYASRQYVVHGLITVNGKRVDKPSATVQVGDVVSVKENKKSLQCFEMALESAQTPGYLELDKGSKSVRLVSVPKQEDIPLMKDLDLSLIIEIYSR